jgi:hypothetical protein
MHNVQSALRVGTFPFAVQCCNSNPTLSVTALTVANSLTAVSDENGGVRLLDTSPYLETAFTTEHIRLQCHDNAIFDIDWSADDMKLVPTLRTQETNDRLLRRVINLGRYSIL